MCVNFKSRHFSNYTIFRLENLFKVLYDGEGITSYTIPEEFKYCNYFLVNVYTLRPSTFDGTSTYLLSRHSDTTYGYFMPTSQYNYIRLKNNIIEKAASTTSQIKIKTIVTLF